MKILFFSRLYKKRLLSADFVHLPHIVTDVTLSLIFPLRTTFCRLRFPIDFYDDVSSG